MGWEVQVGGLFVMRSLQGGGGGDFFGCSEEGFLEGLVRNLAEVMAQ